MHVLYLVGIECALAMLSDGLSRTGSVIVARLGGKARREVTAQFLQHAQAAALTEFEDSQFQDRLARAKRQIGDLGLLLTALQVLQDTVTLALLCLCIAWFSLWLIPFLLATVAPVCIYELHVAAQLHAESTGRTEEFRQIEYWMTIAASPRTIKEILTSTRARRPRHDSGACSIAGRRR